MAQVTVIMSVYNAMPFLEAAVGSILGQTLRDFVFLIVDDGSTDGSGGFLDDLKDPRVQVVHAVHEGPGAARNRALGRCETEFIAMMDADDISLPTRLEEQRDFLHDHKEIGLVGTKISYLGGRSEGFAPPIPCDHDGIYAALLACRPAMFNGSIMCRSSRLRQIGGYRVAGSGEDVDMFLRMGEIAGLANLDKVLYLYRQHPQSISLNQLEETRLYVGWAAECARLRADGKEEIPFETFREKKRAMPLWDRAADRMDLYALAHYRRALSEILGGRKVRGYGRLALASLCSPRWTIQRLARSFACMSQRGG